MSRSVVGLPNPATFHNLQIISNIEPLPPFPQFQSHFFWESYASIILGLIMSRVGSWSESVLTQIEVRAKLLNYTKNRTPGHVLQQCYTAGAVVLLFLVLTLNSACSQILPSYTLLL